MEMNTLKIKDLAPVAFHYFDGNKNPVPPLLQIHEGLPIELVRKKNDSVNTALEHDLSWLVNVIQNVSCGKLPTEWAGHMTRKAKDKESDLGPATNFLFGPLIDAPPSNPDTVLTALMYIEQFLTQHNQRHLHISADMQLYKIVMQIKWSYPDRWQHLIARPGGMHIMMSFIGCIGTLMCSSGLEDILEVAFKGVPNMLLGKAWPKALCGLRMVVEALLEPLITQGNVTVHQMEQALEDASASRTGRLWVDCLIKPVIILLLFIRAEREGNWLLHLYSLHRMLPYFFAAAHWNYARYIKWHLLEMAFIPPELMESFLQGEHVCRHKKGVWNALSQDQFGEQTYIRCGKGKGGLVGKSLSQEQVAGWTLSHHLCNMLSLAYERMYDKSEEETSTDTNSHKQEGVRRKQLDALDRYKIFSEVKKYTNPL